jgi:hypothetical protein
LIGISKQELREKPIKELGIFDEENLLKVLRSLELVLSGFYHKYKL